MFCVIYVNFVLTIRLRSLRSELFMLVKVPIILSDNWDVPGY